MPRVVVDASLLKRPGTKRRPKSAARVKRTPAPPSNSRLISTSTASALALAGGILAVWLIVAIHSHYAISLQTPFLLRFQWPVVISERIRTENAYEAQRDQRHALTAYQQYACQKFGADCRVALAIQRAENPQGKCEIYHYNTDGTLDWGYFQINTVHLKRPGLNLRDLLDCKANIDFAYQLFVERHGFTPWSTFNNGAYRRNLH